MIKLENKKSKLKLEYDYGLNQDGKNIIRSKTYSNIVEDVELDNLNEVADMISDFSSKTLKKKKVLTESEIVEEE